VADIEHPLIFVVGELQSHFLLHLQAKHNMKHWLHLLFLKEDTEKGGKNIRVGRRKIEKKRLCCPSRNKI